MSRPNRFKTLALYSVSFAALVLGDTACANPEGGQITQGAATLQSTDKKLDIIQHTQRVVIDWRRFDIDADEHTQFHQPSAGSIALNRVNSTDPSRILGTLTANGTVILINPNGVFFGPGSKVDVSSLVATSADIRDSDFMSGNLNFDRPGRSDASVVNHGHITAKEAGLVALVAPHAANHGIIEARLGRVALASGDTMGIDLYGDGLFNLKISDNAASQLVENTGAINAAGGTILITAAAGKQIVNSLVDIKGELKAPSIEKRNGKIIISAEGRNAVADNNANAKGQKSGTSRVTLAGTVDVSGLHAGETGGHVTVTADDITLKSTSSIDATGHSGGGVVRVGGEYLGLGRTPVAFRTHMEQHSKINVSALTQGHGGEAILFSDDHTKFYGDIKANGAGIFANGGFIETSGKNILFADGQIQARGSGGGKAGKWLLDPADITIGPTATSGNINISGGTYTATTNTTPSFVLASTLNGVLQGGTSVEVNTGAVPGGGAGDIFVTSAINGTGGANVPGGGLTLSAFRNITVSSTITLNNGALVLRADNTGIGAGSIRTTAAITTNGGNITMGGGAGAITAATFNANGSINTAATGFTTGINLANYYNGITIGANVNAGGGNILMNGRSFLGTAGANNIGVEQLAGFTIETNGNGSVQINGISRETGGSNGFGTAIRGNVFTVNGNIEYTGIAGNGTLNNNFGVLLSNAGGITRTGNGGAGSGNIIVNGIAGATNNNAGAGVAINNINGLSSQGTGGITIYGSGGTATTGAKEGVIINPGGNGTIVGNGGTITITGIGAVNSTTSGNNGIRIQGAAGPSGFITNSGDIIINATGGGSGASANNHGLVVQGANGSISTSGSGNIEITATGGNIAGTGGTNHGVFSSIANGIVTNGTGNITINGTRGGQATSFGFITNVANGVRTAGTAGNISIASDTFSLNLANNVVSAGTIGIATRTGITMGVGTGAGALSFTNAFIGFLNAATGYIFGSTTTSDLTINTATNFGDRNLTFLSGGNISLAGTITKSSGTGAANYLFRSFGNITNAGSAVITTGTGTINITLQSDFDANNDGAVNLTGGTFNTNGGNITIGGGNGTITAATYNPDRTVATPASGFARGNAVNVNGVRIASALNANGGNIIINGQGFSQIAAGNNIGVVNTSAISTTGLGTINIYGIGGAGSFAAANANNYGVNTGALISTANGALNITGFGGGGTNANTNSFGINIGGVNRVSTSGAGSITLNGTGGGTGAAGFGYGLSVGGGGGGDAVRTTGTGDIIINAMGGPGTGASNNGIVLSGTISAAVNRNITIRAFGTTIGSQGVYNNQDSSVTTTGTGNTTVFLNIYGENGGAITTGFRAGHTLTLANYSNATSSFGTTGGALSLTDVQLAKMAAGTAYVFGSTTTAAGAANTGLVTFNSANNYGDRNISIISGGNINLGGTLTKSSGAGTANYLLQADGDITNTSGAGIQATSGAITLVMNSNADTLATGSITLTNAPLLVGGGTITLNSNGQNITQSGNIGGHATLNSGNGNVTIGTLNANIAGTRDLTVNVGTGSFSATSIGATTQLRDLTVTAQSHSFSSALGTGTPLRNVTLTSVNGISLPAISASGNISVLATAATADITLGGNISSTAASGNSIILAAGRDLVNSGNHTLGTSGTARWQIYSGDTANATMTTGGLTGFNRYGCVYSAGLPSCAVGTNIPASGNGFYYAFAPTLTVTGLTATKIYDAGTSATLTGGAFSGLLNGDVLSVDITGITGTYADKNVGVGKTINLVGSVASSVNVGYLITQPTTATGTITAKTITLSGLTANNKIYDATTAASLSGTGVLVGVETGDTVGFSAGTASFSDQNVGVGKTVTASGFTLNGTDSGNYTLTQPGTWLANITQAILTVTLFDPAPSRQVGQANPAFTLSYAGFAGSDTIAVIDSLPVGSTTATISSAAGLYNITISGGSDNNYDIQYTNPAGTLTVTNAPPPANTNTDLPNTVVITSQKPDSVVALDVSEGNAFGLMPSPTSDNALYAGLVTIHPDLVRLLNLKSNTKSF